MEHFPRSQNDAHQLEMSSLINKSRKEYSLKYFMAFKAKHPAAAAL